MSVNKLALTKVGLNVRDWLTLSALFFWDIRAEGRRQSTGDGNLQTGWKTNESDR